jgi:hypothetical protein
MRTAIIIPVLCFALPAPADADWVPLLPGPAERVVAAAGHAAVVRSGEVWLLRDDGGVVGRVGKRGDEKESANRQASPKEAEEILDLLGVSEIDRDTDWAFDLLDDERTLAQRRNAQPRSLPPLVSSETPPALAAGAGDIWIAGNRGLLRVGPNGEVIRERGRQAPGWQIAAARKRLLLARPDGLALLSVENGEERFFPLPAPAGRVALSASGRRWAWTSPAGIAWASDAANTETLALTGPVVDLTYCGETLVALLADSVLAVPAGAIPEVRSRDIHAHRFFCSEGESMPWLAVGHVLLISFDQGRQWKTIATPAGLSLADVAATTRHLWLATNKGLYFSSEESEPVPFLAPTAKTASPRSRRVRGTAAWLSFLPKVSVRATAAIAPSGRQLEALALAAFPLAPSRTPIVAAALDEPAVPSVESVHPRRPERVMDLRDPDGECLILARRKAVELAMTEPERARSYVTRAGRAAWLPELRVLVSRRYGRSESLDVSSSSTALSSPLGIDTVNDIRYEARATWDLGKLVFSTEELAAQTQALHMAELRRDIEGTMNRLYFERRRLALDVAGAGGSARHLRESEIEAELDSLSAGAFGSCASKTVLGAR